MVPMVRESLMPQLTEEWKCPKGIKEYKLDTKEGISNKIEWSSPALHLAPGIDIQLVFQ